MIFIVDPIEALLRCAAKRWPALNVRVQFVDGDDLPDDALGATSFPPEGEDGPIIVSVRGDLDGIAGTLDIMAHELAHAACGSACDGDDPHHAQWREAYLALNNDFVALDGYMPLRSVGPAKPLFVHDENVIEAPIACAEQDRIILEAFRKWQRDAP